MDEDKVHNDEIVDQTTFRFQNNQLSFSREVNPELSDPLVNHAIEQTKLDVVNTDSWTETLFYGVGNKSV